MRRTAGVARSVRPPTVLAAIAAIHLAACGPATGSAAPSATARAIVVTFQVADDQRFKVLLTDPADIDIAAKLLDGDDVPSIPNGRVIRETGVNAGYHWSLDPNDFEFADVTTEVCDGLPSDVEAGLVSGDRYCPWSAQVVAVDPAP